MHYRLFSFLIFNLLATSSIKLNLNDDDNDELGAEFDIQLDTKNSDNNVTKLERTR